MQESTTYQYILTEGAIKEARKILLRQGEKQLGPSGAAIKLVLAGVTDLERLERMADRVHEVSSWQDLLDTP